MRIVLITTLPSLIENQRLEEEAEKLGHSFQLINLKDFSFQVKENQLKVAAMANLKVDLVIVRGIFNSIKPISAVITDLKRRGGKVFDNNFLTHRYSIDKVSDLIKLSLAGLPVPETAYTRDFADYLRLAKELGYPLVIKSTRMGKGASVFRFNTRAELMSFIDQCQEEGKAAKNFLLQEFIPYVYDLRILIIGERVLTMRRIPAPGEFRANFSLGGEVEAFDLDQKGRELALRALKRMEMSVAGVDMLMTKDNQRYLLEVNHTAGFVGMEKAVGENIGKLYLEHAIREGK